GAAVVLEEEVQRKRRGRGGNGVLIDKAVQDPDIQEAGFRERDRACANAHCHPERGPVGRVTAACGSRNGIERRRIESEASGNRIAGPNSGGEVVNGDLGGSSGEVEGNEVRLRKPWYE